MKTGQRQMRAVRRELVRQGFTVTPTGSGHFKITHPHLRSPVFCPGSPSDWRSIRNVRAELKRKLRPPEAQ